MERRESVKEKQHSCVFFFFCSTLLGFSKPQRGFEKQLCWMAAIVLAGGVRCLATARLFRFLFGHKKEGVKRRMLL